MKITKFFALMCAAIAFVGCDDSNPDGPGKEPIPPVVTGDLELTASVEIGEMGKPITFTVMQGEDEELGENIVSEEFMKGYMYRDSVVRHSMVKVVNC